MYFSRPPRPLNPCRKTDDVFAMKLVFFFRIFRCITSATLLMSVTSDVLTSAAEEIFISFGLLSLPDNLRFAVAVGWEARADAEEELDSLGELSKRSNDWSRSMTGGRDNFGRSLGVSCGAGLSLMRRRAKLVVVLLGEAMAA